VRVRLGIVADDLTGANAVGAQVAETGLPSIVTSDPAALAAWAADLPAAVLNVDSRADGPERAAQKVRAAVAALRKWGAGIFYKKTDSTLRGNLGAEIDAFREAAGAALLPFVPASPLNARVTVDGVQLVEGRPLAETWVARRAIPPIPHSAVAAILGQQSRAPVAALLTAAGREAAEALAVRAWGCLGGNALTAPTTGCYCGALSGSRSER